MREFVRVTAAVAALSTAWVLPATAKEWKTVTVGTEGAYEPWNLTKPDGSFDGYEVEVLHDVCGRMKIECKIVAQDWDGMIPALQAGKIDVIMDALSVTDERRKTIDFSTPYAVTPGVFVADKTGALANAPGTGTTVKLGSDARSPTMDELRQAFKGKTIGLQTATVYEPFVVNNFKDVATIKEYKTAAEHDLDLTSGRVDLAFDDATYFTAAFAKPENKDMAYTGPQIGGLVWGPGEAFGIRQADRDLKVMFDKALGEAVKDGTIKALSLKWFKIDVAP